MSFPQYHVMNPLHALFMSVPKRQKVIVTDNGELFHFLVMLCYEEEEDFDSYISHRFKHYCNNSVNDQSS